MQNSPFKPLNALWPPCAKHADRRSPAAGQLPRMRACALVYAVALAAYCSCG